MHRALYKVYIDFPNYDYIEVHSTNVKTHRKFIRKARKMDGFYIHQLVLNEIDGLYYYTHSNIFYNYM